MFILDNISFFGKLCQRRIAVAVRIEFIDSAVAEYLPETAHLFFSVTVDTVISARMRVDVGRHQTADPQSFTDRLQQKQGRRGDNHVILPLLSEIKSFDFLTSFSVSQQRRKRYIFSLNSVLLPFLNT